MAWHIWRGQKEALETRQNLARHIAHFFLLSSASTSLILFVRSDAAVNAPANHARYLVGLLIATPAILWPLWLSARNITQRTGRLIRASSIASTLVIALIGILYVTGTILVFTEIPLAQTYNQQDQAMIARLESLRATHIYAGYWTCNRLIFLSR